MTEAKPTRRWALITGASAGIGAATARRLATDGWNLALWARREARLADVAGPLTGDVAIRTAAIDIRDRGEVEGAVEALERDGIGIDALINNAGMARGQDPIQTGDPRGWDEMLDTNVKGLLAVTRAVLPGMIARDRGHIVNLGSTAGHWVYPGGNVYNATKYAVKALTQAISIDTKGTRIRVSSIDPGFVRTEFSRVRFPDDPERADGTYAGFEPLRAEDIADCIAWVLERPENVNILDMIVVPTAQRTGTVVHREEG
ncbi:MAG: SDR family NAD(P)-dependent oxidoreductase [Longimicrobiales bacterium]